MNEEEQISHIKQHTPLLLELFFRDSETGEFSAIEDYKVSEGKVTFTCYNPLSYSYWKITVVQEQLP